MRFTGTLGEVQVRRALNGPLIHIVIDFEQKFTHCHRRRRARPSIDIRFTTIASKIVFRQGGMPNYSIFRFGGRSHGF